MNNSRIKIFTGHYGSGKTEVAINFAIYSKKYYNRVAIIDLDIVNPYFRTKDAAEILEQHGIQLVAPQFANTNVDIPALPAEIFSVLQDKDCQVIFDVGGDDDGATALGRYHRYFSAESYQMFFVINTRRPLTDNVNDTIELLRAVEKNSRLKVTDLINNTNLSYHSTVKDIMDGQEIVENISREIMVPITYITGKKEVVSQISDHLKEKAFGIDLFLQLPWHD
ncbi:ATP-binding protein [Petroclostridium sp. X23]|uniref:ATP-binding protein n=1 Tax=Petroclostridium sp. X23 TaxID=3045146 RepID=UPI0024AE253A|nr:ATP-binding protein [Petroclostridium sp. X23]WHH59625.1 ATP-binding protein [Petroclostridium sp. X23]